MSQFDLDQYFAERLGRTTTEKMTEVKQASDEKLVGLQQYRSNLASHTQDFLKQKAAQEQSWAGQLGLDPDGLAAAAVNLGANAYSGTSRVLGDLTALPFAAYAMANEAGLTEADHKAYANYKKGIATPADLAQLNRKAGTAEAGMPPVATVMQLFEQANTGRTAALNIDESFDRSSVVDPTRKTQLGSQLEEGFTPAWDQLKGGVAKAKDGAVLDGSGDVVAGIAKLIYNAGESAINNKQASAEYIAENLPQLMIGGIKKVGGALLSASNIGYASDYYQQGIKKYQDENDGAYPPEKQRMEMAAYAASAAAAEHLGDKVGLAVGKLGSKAATDEAIKTGFKQALKNTGKAAAEGALSESLTEGYQTFAEGQASLKPASAKDIYVGAAIGGITGSGMSGGMRGVAEYGQATPEHVEARQQAADQAVEFSKAVEQNDPTSFLDKKSSNYNPTKAIGVLLQNTLSDTATPEIKQANLKKAEDILSKLEAQHTVIADRVKSHSPEEIQYVKDNIEHVKTQLKDVDPADKEKVQLFKDILSTYNKDLAARNDKNQAVAAQSELTKLSEHIRQGRKQIDALVSTTHPTLAPTELASHIELADSTPDVADTAAVETARQSADTVINLSMRNPDAVDGLAAKKLADNKDNALTAQQRDYLRVFSEARTAENTLKQVKDVAQEVLMGTPKHAGIVTWRNRMATAIAAGNASSAAKQLKGIQSFAADHQAKAEAFAKALPLGFGTQIQKENDQWVVVPASDKKKILSDKALKENGGLMVKPKSEVLLEQLKTEVKALAASSKEMAAIHALKFGEKATAVKQADVQSDSSAAQPSVSPVLSVREKERERDVESVDKSTLPSSSQKSTPSVSEVTSTADKAQPAKVASTQAVEQETAKQQGAPATPAAAAVTAKTEDETTAAYPWIESKKYGDKFDVEMVEEIAAADPAFAKAKYKELSTKEKETLSKVWSAIRTMFNTELEFLKIVAMSNHTAHGVSFTDINAIALNTGLLAEGDVQRITRVLAHELAHKRDASFYWNLSNIAAFQPNGDIYEQAKQAMSHDATLAKAFEYIFKTDSKYAADKQAQELYAQLHAYYLTNPEYFNEEGPLSTAYSLFGKAHQVQQGGVAVAQSGNDGKGSDAKSTASTNDGQGTSDSRQSTVSKEDWEADVAAAEANIKQADTAATPASETALPSVASLTTADAAPASSLAAESPSKSGVLTTLANRTAKGVKALYSQRHLIADYFKQVAGKANEGTVKPLASVSDFLSALRNDPDLAKSFLKDTDLEGKQGVIDTFVKLASDWQAKIEKSFIRYHDGKPGQENFRYADLTQFFIHDDKVDMDENVKTAISYAAFTAMLDLNSANRLNSAEDINGILGNRKDAPVDPKATSLLADKGKLQGVLINSWGKDVLAALGLKPNSKAPQNLLPDLEAAFGDHVYKLLLELGVIETTSLTKKELDPFSDKADKAPKLTAKQMADNALASGIELTKEQMIEINRQIDADIKASNTEINFIRLVRDARFAEDPKDKYAKYAPHTLVQTVYNANKGTQSVLSKLFSVEAFLHEPTLKPVDYTQEKAGDGRMDVPSTLAKILEQQNKAPHHLRTDLWNAVIGQVSPEIALAMAGFEDVSEKAMHKYRRMAVQAKNDGLVREYERLREFVGSTLSKSKEDPIEALQQPIFFEHDSWIQQRVGKLTNMINPQTSKIHRHMLYQPTWETTVDIHDKDSFDNFRLRVAEGLGVKTDKQGNDVSLAAFNNLLMTQHTDETKFGKEMAIQAAVKVLQKALDITGLTEAEQATLAKGVKAGGENFHSLDALMAMAHYANAVAAGQTTFTVQMMGEVDGVTNGPMLSHLLYGAAQSAQALFALLNRGGFFQQGNEHSQYNLWRGVAGHLDLYETTTRHVLDRIPALLKNTNAKEGINTTVLEAVYAFTGKLEDANGSIKKEGRNIIKTPLTAIIFGASVSSSIDSMADKFVESVYAAIEKLAATPDEQAKRELIANLSKLGVSWNNSMTIQQMLDTEFTDSEVKQIKRAFKNTLGRAVQPVIDHDFKDFLTQRDSLNKTAQLASAVYSAVYNAVREEVVTDLIAKGEIETKIVEGKPQPIQDLTIEQEQEVQKRVAALEPIMHSAMSKDSGELNAGLFIGKTERSFGNNPSYTGRTHFGTVIPGTKVKGMAYKGYEEKLVGPGVGMAALSTHSFDSRISHYAAKLLQVLNVHDAHGAGLAIIQEAARNLNKATWDALLDYSPVNEVHEAYMRTLRGLAGMMESDQLPANIKEHLAKALVEITESSREKEKPDPMTLLSQTAKDSKELAHKADSVKLAAMAMMQAIDQYALEGGNYEVQESDRLKAKALLQDLVASLSKEDETLIDKIEQQISPLIASKQKVKAVIAKAKSAPAAAVTPATSALAQLGTPLGKHDDKLTAAFKAKPNQTVKEVVALLRKTMKDDFSMKLLSQLERTVDGKLTVKYITKDTLPSELVHSDISPTAMGMYQNLGPNIEQQAIYVMSDDFVNSGLTAEVLLHEMVHAALTVTVRAEQSERDSEITYNEGVKPAKPYTSDALKLVEELEDLMELAKQYVAESEVPERIAYYARAFENLDEFIAYGMTNKEFQQDVLTSIAYTSKNTGNVLVTVMRAFIDKITALFFGRQNTLMSNGMEAFLTNVSGLFEQASKQQKPNVGPVSLKMTVDPVTGLIDYTTTDIYAALGQHSNNGHTVSPTFDQHLTTVLDSIVGKLYGPFGAYKKDLMAGRNVTPQAIYTEALATGKAPYAAESVVAGINLTEQEAFVFDQVEAVVREGIETQGGSTFVAYRELAKLYAEVRSKLTVADFHVANATPAEIAEAQRVYDFIFGIKLDSNNKSNYLARFAAMGMAHEGFNDLLKMATARENRSTAGMSFNERLNQIVHNILDWFAGKWTRTFDGQQVDAKLIALVTQLATNEARRIAVMERRTSVATTIANGLDTMLLGKREAIRSKMDQFGKSKFFKSNSSGFVRATGGLISTYGGHRIKFLMDAFEDFRNTHFDGQQGLAAGILNEARGSKFSNVIFHFLLRGTKVIEGNRKDLITGYSKVVLESFANQGNNLSQLQKAALSQIVLRGDMQALLPHYTMDQIMGLIHDQSKIAKEVKAWEAKLGTLGKSSTFRTYWINAAETLAYHMATGKATDDNLMRNAGNIARLYETGYERRITESEAQAAEKIIDPLVSLMALSYMRQDHMLALREVAQAEANRTDKGNGIEMLLLTHQALQEKAQKLLFSDGKALFVKGYTPEIYDPYMAVTVANAQDGAELVKQGYKPNARVAKDAYDDLNSDDLRLYTLRDGGLIRWVSGIISTTDGKAKGNRMHNGQLSTLSYTGAMNASNMATMKAKKRQAIQAMFTKRHTDPAMVKGTFYVPLLNANGEAVNYRYLMEESTKDSLLARDNRPEQLLGIMAGNMYDKVASKDQNRQAIKALHSQYKEEFAQNPRGYLKVGPTSADPELREIYRLLPHHTKEAIRDIWGSDNMYVRSDILDMNFGYRKLSAANMFNKEEFERSFVEKMLVQIGTYAFNEKAPLRVRQAENVWQEVIKATKSNLVVKAISTLMGNFRSNVSQLLLIGVSPTDILKHHRVAFKGAWDYRNDSSELFKLEHLITTGYIPSGMTKADIKHRILVLQDAIARNPVKPLIDAGLMPTIVEDVAADDDLHSYKSKFAKKVTSFTDKLNPHVTEVGKWLLMTEDTTPFKVMSYATQISDFLARYTLYQHLTTRKDEPLKHENAIQYASDAFINYDIPAHRTMQYLNDMGIINFSKYYIRIQKMIGKMYKDHPGRIMMMLTLEKWFGNQPTVLDSSVLVRFGNPLNMGILEYPNSLDSLTTVKMLTMPFSGPSHPGQ